MAFQCLFQSFSYKSFANVPPKGGDRAPLGPSPKSATVLESKDARIVSAVVSGEQKNVNH